MSDKMGPRTVMYWVLGVIAICCLLLVFPKMTVESPGQGVMARRAGTVTYVAADEIRVDDVPYALQAEDTDAIDEAATHILPAVASWHVPNVAPDQLVVKRDVLATGVTKIYFEANVVIFTILVFFIGIAMGIGKAAVYKYIPEYFPTEVGVVGGMVGVLGGLGGFVCPIIFGALLESIGLWTSTWIFFFIISMTCLIWLHLVVKRISKRETHIEEEPNVEVVVPA